MPRADACNVGNGENHVEVGKEQVQRSDILCVIAAADYLVPHPSLVHVVAGEAQVAETIAAYAGNILGWCEDCADVKEDSVDEAEAIYRLDRHPGAVGDHV